MKRFVVGFVTGVAVLGIGAVIFARLGCAEVRADVTAPAWQASFFHLATRNSIRRRAKTLEPPSVVTDGDLIAGGKLYVAGCAGCHGMPGGARRTRPLFFPPPELAHAESRYSLAERFWVIKHGIRRTGMSAYGPFYSDQDIWRLAMFVGRLSALPPSISQRLQPKPQ